MSRFIIKLLAKIYAAWVHRQERRIGYRLEFSHIPQAWINGWMIYDMAYAWPKHKIKADWVNYFTLGSLVNGLSSRFVRGEKQYQSWLGAYLVKFKEDKDFTLQDHFNLAIADQKNWLRSFGDPKPFIEMPAQKATGPELITIGNFEGKLYELFGGPSHSDVGNKSVNLETKLIMPIMAGVMNLSNPDLKLEGKNFLPKDRSSNYETVTLKGYVAIVELEKNLKLVLYGNGAAIHNPNGEDTDYYPQLKQDILLAFKSIIIKNLNRYS